MDYLEVYKAFVKVICNKYSNYYDVIPLLPSLVTLDVITIGERELIERRPTLEDRIIVRLILNFD